MSFQTAEMTISLSFSLSLYSLPLSYLFILNCLYPSLPLSRSLSLSPSLIHQVIDEPVKFINKKPGLNHPDDDGRVEADRAGVGHHQLHRLRLRRHVLHLRQVLILCLGHLSFGA